jgi:winged helix-turn-helix DNA-binding protein
MIDTMKRNMTMFRKFDSVKTLKALIKLAAVAITGPATVSVASNLYSTDPLLRVIVSVAALILVEGCLLLGWEMLDQQGKNATMTQRWLYAGLAWVAYFSLFVIAINHNEGMAGLTFRLTLGVVLLYTSVEAGLLAGIKREGQTDRDIFSDWQVKRYARKLARKSAMADLDSTTRMRQIDREVVEKLYSLQKTRETDQQVRDIRSGNSLDSRIVVETSKSPVSTNSLDMINRKRRLSKRQALDKTLQILSTNPTMNPSDIADQIGKSRQTVYDYMDELEAAGKLHRNGSAKVIR